MGRANTMHICDVTLFFAPHSGGVKRYLLAKHNYLSRHSGFRHSLLVPGPRDIEIAPGIFEVRSPRIPFGGGYRLPMRPSRWREAMCSLAPDLIEVGDPYHLAWAAFDAADALGIPVAAFAHSDLSCVVASRFGRVAGKITDRYLRKLYARCDLVFAPSRLIAERLSELGVERVVVQRLGVDAETFHPRRFDPHLRAQLCLSPDTRLLIFAGRMSREKQIPRLFEAFALLGQPYHLLLVGGEIRESVSENVTLLPYEQDSVRLARLLASADALVHAGMNETFGLIVVEAMACGRPVVGMRSGAVAELIDDRVGILAASNDAHGLRQAIEELYKRDWQQMGRCARKRVENDYSWPSVFTSQSQSYSRLACAPPVSTYAATDVPSVP
jgi:alpha-1,6-mannosyltransferase